MKASFDVRDNSSSTLGLLGSFLFFDLESLFFSSLYSNWKINDTQAKVPLNILKNNRYFFTFQATSSSKNPVEGLIF
jgi:hypothetical protein